MAQEGAEDQRPNNCFSWLEALPDNSYLCNWGPKWTLSHAQVHSWAYALFRNVLWPSCTSCYRGCCISEIDKQSSKLPTCCFFLLYKHHSMYSVLFLIFCRHRNSPKLGRVNYFRITNTMYTHWEGRDREWMGGWLLISSPPYNSL